MPWFISALLRGIMPCKKVLFALLPAIFWLPASRASAQASVTENQSTYIYVDAKNGSDSNSGTQSSPLKTIQTAINKADADNQKGIGVKIIVNPGVYRETVTISNYKSTSAVLTVQAATTGTAIISGSNVITNWANVGGGIYSHVWTEALGWCSIPSGWPTTFAKIALRTEMVFVNGNPLTQVMSHADLRPGTFFVSDGSSMMYIYPSPSVTISTRNRGGRRAIEDTFHFQTLEHCRSRPCASSCHLVHQSVRCGASMQALTSFWIQCRRSGTTGADWAFIQQKVTVKNSVSSHNGGVGFTAAKDQNMLFDFNESDYNNWRGAQAALFDWGMGGTKLMYMRNTTVQHHFSYNNQGAGLVVRHGQQEHHRE